MADIYGGRVLAGEDSEEDDEDEAEMGFQFNGFATPAAPRFAVSTVATPPAGAEGKEDDGSDEEEETELQLKVEVKTVEVKGEQDEDEEQAAQAQDKKEEPMVPDTKKPTEEVVKTEEKQELWKVDESVNGIEVMSNAFVGTVLPSLDATIHRIAELKESQRRLLKMLTEQNTAIKSHRQLEDAAVVLEKLPFYANKLQNIKLAMQEISASTEKMKRRAEGLRIDAQSHAIKKENKRDAQSQWNKLYAAKNAPGSGAASGQS